MPEARTAENLDLGNHEAGYEWVAGEMPPRGYVPGVCFVRKYTDCWTVIFRSAAGAEYIIQPFRLTDNGERAAKVMANKLVNRAWAKYRN